MPGHEPQCWWHGTQTTALEMVLHADTEDDALGRIIDASPSVSYEQSALNEPTLLRS